MPTVMRAGPYRIFFYASDREEPQHVHVERDANVAKFWLDPIRLARSGGFGRAEIRQVHELLERYQAELMGAWDDYFGH